MSTFAERIKSFRTGMTTAEFAKKIGISTGSLNNYERGVNVPSGKKLIHISEQLGVDIEWLLHGAGMEEKTSEMPARVKAENRATSLNCLKCLELYEKLGLLYDKLIQAQERENALLKENAALKAENAELSRPSLSSNGADERPHAITA